MTHLCISTFVNSVEQARRDTLLAAEAGADLVELRIDKPPLEPDWLERLLKNLPVPAIVTCRPEWEGGRSTLDMMERGVLLAMAAEDGAKLVDIELRTLQQSTLTLAEIIGDQTPDQRPRIIVSSHDFMGRPERLYNILHELTDSGGDINKIVWTARSIRDNIEAFEILLQKQKPTIALCMGEAGMISRILARKFGGFLTFASLTKDSATAPGQITIEEMKRIYRWDKITPETKVFGVVGSPIMHSMSPAIHNAAFDEIGYDGIYLPLRVEPGYESFKAFMETFLNFEPLHLTGLSVTIPHKENALRYLQEKTADIEPLAASIGAVNTIAIKRESGQIRLQGINTDYAAILDSITAKMNITREDLSNYRVAVIGAGGTGRTAVAALAAYGATVVVYNRTQERADELAQEFDGHTGKVVSARMEKLCDSCCHIFINTTSVGMYPNVDVSPFGDRLPKFSDETVVFDTIYNPIKTKLLEQAERAGAKTIPGIEMFVRQAVGQFQLWTDKTAPAETMRRVIAQRLSQSK